MKNKYFMLRNQNYLFQEHFQLILLFCKKKKIAALPTVTSPIAYANFMLSKPHVDEFICIF